MVSKCLIIAFQEYSLARISRILGLCHRTSLLTSDGQDAFLVSYGISCFEILLLDSHLIMILIPITCMRGVGLVTRDELFVEITWKILSRATWPGLKFRRVKSAP